MIRSVLFTFFFFLGIIFISIIFLPSLLLPQKFVLFGGKLMGYWSTICLKLFLSVDVKIKGIENILKDKKFFIAASHQSMFETFFLQTIFNSPVFILKKELLLIPIFGWYLKKIGSISINRNKITRENLNFFEDISKVVKNSNRPLIIFPQATRVLPNERIPFKKGVGKIYDNLKIYCQPIAINSGSVWPKKGKKSPNKEIIVSILKPIAPGLTKENFLSNLENKIYLELDLID
jgi:1-acyl-sn-glycerol-3-phosphate acyltransferase